MCNALDISRKPFLEDIALMGLKFLLQMHAPLFDFCKSLQNCHRAALVSHIITSPFSLDLEFVLDQTCLGCLRPRCSCQAWLPAHQQLLGVEGLVEIRSSAF